MASRIEDYAHDRRSRHRRAGRPRRLDRLAVLAALRFRCLLRRAARHARTRPLADRAAETERGEDHAPLPAQHADPGDALRDRRGRGDADRFHAAARRATRISCASSSASAARVDIAWRADAALRLRRHRAVGDADRRQHAARHRRPDMVVLRSPVQLHGENFKTVGEFTVAAGETRAVRAVLRALASSRCRSRSMPSAAARRPRNSGPNGRARTRSPAPGTTR